MGIAVQNALSIMLATGVRLSVQDSRHTTSVEKVSHVTIDRQHVMGLRGS